MRKEREIAEKETVPEAPILAKYQGEFEFNGPSARKLLNGNKIHVILECDYTPEAMAQLAFFMDKDVKVNFKEMVSKKRRKKVGDEDTPALFGDEGVGPD